METSERNIGPGKPAAIDQLPAAIRQKVIDLLLSDDPHATVKAAKLSGVSRVAVLKYKSRHIIPALQIAAKARAVNISQGIDTEPMSEAKAIAKVSIVQSHLDGYRNRLETAMNRLEAIGAKPDATAAEIAAIGPVARAAHENLRILGELTGELGSGKAGMTVNVESIYLNIPRGTRDDDERTIDVTCEPSE